MWPAEDETSAHPALRVRAGTYHSYAQSGHCCQEGCAAPSRGPPRRLGEARQRVSLAASWKTVGGVCEGARWRSHGQENPTQVGVGGQHQDPRQLQGKTATWTF